MRKIHIIDEVRDACFPSGSKEFGRDTDCAPSGSGAWWWGPWRLQKAILRDNP